MDTHGATNIKQNYVDVNFDLKLEDPCPTAQMQDFKWNAEDSIWYGPYTDSSGTTLQQLLVYASETASKEV